MRIAMFYHSLVSDWNHGNAHFLRGIVSELMSRGHQVAVYEPADGWSAQNLRREHGEIPIRAFHRAYPALRARTWSLASLDLERELDGVDLVIVHEWNPHELVRRVGELRSRSNSFRLLFHDTHHRSVTDTAGIAGYDLRHYDGVLAFGDAIRSIYLRSGWTQRAWTWHEAADTRVFRPVAARSIDGDLVWIGNWGDGERAAELSEFLMEPVRALALRARVHGVRYPAAAIDGLKRSGIEYADWLPNFQVPAVFSRFRVTVHVPRRPYARALPGIPTIRLFEALACGIPLVSAPWSDTEGLFRAGVDYLIARTGAEMKSQLRAVLHEPALAASLRANGLETIRARHTCVHRVDELLAILRELTTDNRQLTTTRSANLRAEINQELIADSCQLTAPMRAST
jgi:spore maturation protein CgeB